MRDTVPNSESLGPWHVEYALLVARRGWGSFTAAIAERCCLRNSKRATVCFGATVLATPMSRFGRPHELDTKTCS
jgi:hypothetical protein